jgi:hypothetical protein
LKVSYRFFNGFAVVNWPKKPYKADSWPSTVVRMAGSQISVHIICMMVTATVMVAVSTQKQHIVPTVVGYCYRTVKGKFNSPEARSLYRPVNLPEA